MKHHRPRLVVLMLCLARLLSASPAAAQVAPPLGVAQQFGVLGNSAVTGAAGAGVVVTGDVGSSPNAVISNFPPSRAAIPFVVHAVNDGTVQQARADAVAAYTALLNQGPGVVLPDNLATVGALGPGIYSFTSGAPNLPASTTLTLNGNGIFIFNVASALTADTLSNVVGTASACNIFWRIGSSATLNGVNFKGTVIANASITVGAGASVEGRVLAGAGATGAVTMAGAGGNTIGGCSLPAPPGCPAITVTPATLPAATVGVAYNLQLVAAGGTAPYSFTVVAGTLPAGLTLTTGGVLGGTPTTGGTSSFTARITDANGCFVEGPTTLVVINAVPTLPRVFLVLLAALLPAVGYARLRRATRGRRAN